jgi:hypothetical protein
MTLVLEATPSSGGPRCLRSRGSRGSRGAASFLASLDPFLAVSASFVVSVRGATWPGTFVGVESAGAASVSSTCSAPSAPSACDFWLVFARLLRVRGLTYSTSATSSAATTATAASTTAGGGTAAVVASTLGTAASALGVSLGSAGQLDGDLAVEDGLAVELSNGTLGLGWGREGNESVADRARSAGVGGDGRGLAVQRVSSGMRHVGRGLHVHQVVLEEVLQLPLVGRIREVSNVKSPALGGARTHSLVLGGRGLRGAGALRGGSRVVEGGGGHLGGDTVDWSGHFY